MDNDTLKPTPNTNTTPNTTTPSPEAKPSVEALVPVPAGDTSIPDASTPAPEAPEASKTPETSSSITPASASSDNASAPDTPLVTPLVDTKEETSAQPAGDNAAKPESATNSKEDTPAPSKPVPINDVEEAPPADPIPLVDAGTAVADAPKKDTSSDDSAKIGPIVSGNTSSKNSPILNSAPAKVQKFDLKYIIPIAVLGVLVLGLGGFLLFDKLVSQPQALEEARKAAAAAATPTISNDVDITTGEDEESAPVLIPYSSSKALNGTGTYILTSIDNAPGVSVIANEASTVAQFTINWADAKAAYSDLKTSTGTGTYTIEFGQGLTEIFYGTIGDTGFYLFLLSDGTVDYLDIHQALANKSFAASGPIEGVENVVKFLDATTEGTATILAQQATGDYYDLTTFLK